MKSKNHNRLIKRVKGDVTMTDAQTIQSNTVREAEEIFFKYVNLKGRMTFERLRRR